MRWEKGGLVFATHSKAPWMTSHAAAPTVLRLSDHRLRIFISVRSDANTSSVTFVDADARDPSRILYVHDRPVLESGKRGHFDDRGVGPSCVIERNGELWLYYIGVTPTLTVPYHIAIGLAVSRDGGLSFERACEGPVLDRGLHEPYYATTPFVLEDGDGLTMWYSCGRAWVVIDGVPEPTYDIRCAHSRDGVTWKRVAGPALERRDDAEALARPWVIKDEARYRMWYAYRGSENFRGAGGGTYRIGYAESLDGLRFTRFDERAGIERSSDGWDCEMLAYPAVFASNNALHMYYNGNGFGRSGFGIATLREKD